MTFQPNVLLKEFRTFAIPIFPGEITFQLEENQEFNKIFCSRNYQAKVLEPLEPISRVIIPSNTFTFDQIKLKRFNEMTEENNLHDHILKNEQEYQEPNEEKINNFKQKLNDVAIKTEDSTNNNDNINDKINDEINDNINNDDNECNNNNGKSNSKSNSKSTSNRKSTGNSKINSNIKNNNTKKRTNQNKDINVPNTPTSSTEKKKVKVDINPLNDSSKLNAPHYIKHFIQCYQQYNQLSQELLENSPNYIQEKWDINVYFYFFDLLKNPLYKKHRPIFDETNFDVCFYNPCNFNQIKHAKILERKSFHDNIVLVETEQNQNSFTSQSLVQDNYFWFLLHGIKVKDEGYLHNSNVDLIIQELENEYWFFDRQLLVDFIYSKLPQDGSTVSIPKDAIYNVLKIGNRREMKTLIPAEDVQHLVEFVLPISK